MLYTLLLEFLSASASFTKLLCSDALLKPCIHRKEFGVTFIGLILTNVKGMHMSQTRGRLFQYSHQCETMPIKSWILSILKTKSRFPLVFLFLLLQNLIH